MLRYRLNTDGGFNRVCMHCLFVYLLAPVAVICESIRVVEYGLSFLRLMPWPRLLHRPPSNRSDRFPKLWLQTQKKEMKKDTWKKKGQRRRGERATMGGNERRKKDNMVQRGEKYKSCREH